MCFNWTVFTITVFVEATVDSSTESRKLVGDGFELEKDWKSSGPKLQQIYQPLPSLLEAPIRLLNLFLEPNTVVCC